MPKTTSSPVAIIATFYAKAKDAQRALSRKRHPEYWTILETVEGYWLTTNEWMGDADGDTPPDGPPVPSDD